MDLKTTATNLVKRSTTMFQQDLEALPEEAFTKAFGEKTRTVADIVYEVNLVNDHIGMVIRGEEPFKWPDDDAGWIKAPEGFDTKEAVIKSFKLSSDKTIATAEAFTEEDMAGTVQTEQGETTRFQRFQFMALHMWYHSGQLNYIQTLLGDDAWHW